jgi:hypothetical protein
MALSQTMLIVFRNYTQMVRTEQQAEKSLRLPKIEPVSAHITKLSMVHSRSTVRQ